MPLTILNVAFPFAPVRPDTAGGAEQVVLAMDCAICKAGYNSIVVACKGSETRGTLIETPAIEGDIDDRKREELYPEFRRILHYALKSVQIDCMHFHGLDFDRYIPFSRVPALVTLHLPVGWYNPGIFGLDRPNLYLNCVSLSQQSTCPAARMLLPFVRNGIEVNGLPKPHRGNYAVCIGRICPEKGYHFAIDAARKAGIPLIIAGAVFPYEYHRTYFTKEILPRLDGKRYRFIGPAGPLRKRRLLSSARCVVVPSTVEETSSLVAMESLAFGTPVVAFRKGALAEIIEHGRTGYLVDEPSELADAMLMADRINSNECYRVAGENYTIDKMTEAYLAYYKKISAPAQTCSRGSFFSALNPDRSACN